MSVAETRGRREGYSELVVDVSFCRASLKSYLEEREDGSDVFLEPEVNHAISLVQYQETAHL